MTSPPPPNVGGPEGAGRVDNGLVAVSYVPLTDLDAEVGRQLLTALGRARIAAYLDPAPGSDATQRRLFVNADERADARTIVAAAVRALGGETPAAPERTDDPLAGVDTDAAFAELIADWHVDTVAAIREAERELSREDEEWRTRLQPAPVPEPVWLDEEHYVPPPPPPLPRLSRQTVTAMTILAVAILVLALGGRIGMTSELSLFLGVGGVLGAAGLLIMRLREHHDEDDDGAAV